MKPKKNLVVCPFERGQRQKMLFESESKALNFIKFNAQDLEYGQNSLRAYYCPCCGGWHITHQPLREKYSTENVEKRVTSICRPYKRRKLSVPELKVLEQNDIKKSVLQALAKYTEDEIRIIRTFGRKKRRSWIFEHCGLSPDQDSEAYNLGVNELRRLLWEIPQAELTALIEKV